MTNEIPESNKPESAVPLQQQIEVLLTDLLYPSESDEPIEFVTCYLKQENLLTVSQIKDWLMLPPAIYVEEISEAEFWEPVTQEEEWFGDEEKKQLERFQTLKQIIDQHLSVRQVFRVGDTEIDIYLLGRTGKEGRAGLKTKIVET